MLNVEQLERQTLADRQALLSRGVTEELPTALSEQRRFDAWLNTEPAVLIARGVRTAADEELMALGVA